MLKYIKQFFTPKERDILITVNAISLDKLDPSIFYLSTYTINIEENKDHYYVPLLKEGIVIPVLYKDDCIMYFEVDSSKTIPIIRYNNLTISIKINPVY